MTHVATITRHAIRNYGSVLQAYATQELLRIPFDKVQTLDYRQDGIDDSAGSYRAAEPSLVGTAKHFAYRAFRARDARERGKIFESFLQQNVVLSDDRYIGYQQLAIADHPADWFYCVGSDQVWNIEYNQDNRPYYLSFAPADAVKFSLASSIGTPKLPRHEEQMLRESLLSFARVSVRESDAADYLDSLGVVAEHHVDPVLALPIDTWRRFAASVPPRSDPYVLVYQLNASPELQQASLALGRKLGIPVVRAEYWRTLRGRGASTVLRPTVQELLALFRDATFVITDSFHGTALSALFERQFSSLLPARYGSRITSLLDHLGIPERRGSTTGDALALTDVRLPVDDIRASLVADRAAVADYLSDIARLRTSTR